MENVQNLPPHQQQQFMQKLEQAQMTDSLTMYNNLVERCFEACSYSFRSKTLEKYETSCMENCASRYIKMAQRVGLRFQEHQAMQQQQQQPK
ncbi:membrane translocase subunit TIM9 [Seminavis robusta]|uniref:Mitochondrial import inner membrane translocase subunit n=1 Tax=Seminavis robusta TaxID=568900 RepID=A0A9N8HVA3_9STRA|nr:membrane translocase subunit TIM9 [Seminavis robusta]|eukprot:Sro1768_g296390.1 membrane translocase subunit TIM9 (92) ;mRNA; r:19366-19799